MPGAPSWLDGVNFIDFWSESDCETPWSVYFETAWPALGRAALVLVSFDMADMARSLFRPSGQRQGRHGRKGRKSGKGRRGLPEPSDLIARGIPGQEARATRYVDDGVRHLWKIDGFIQRAQHALLVVDLIDDFTYEWMSAVISDPRTQCGSVGRCMFVNETYTTLAGGWGSIATGDEVYQSGDLQMQTVACNLGPGNWLVNMAAKVKPGDISFPFTTVQLGINRTVAPTNFLGVSSRQTVYQGSEATLVVTAHVQLESDGHVNFRAFTQDDPASWTEVTTRVMQMG